MKHVKVILFSFIFMLSGCASRDATYYAEKIQKRIDQGDLQYKEVVDLVGMPDALNAEEEGVVKWILNNKKKQILVVYYDKASKKVLKYLIVHSY